MGKALKKRCVFCQLPAMQGKQIMTFKASVGSTLEALDPITAGDGSTHNQIKMESSSGSIECFKIKPALEGDRPYLQTSQSQQTFASGSETLQLPQSRFIGVVWDKRDGSWVVNIGHAGRQTRIGSFAPEEEAAAARAYDANARELRGSEAHSTKFKLNFPTVEEEWHRLAAIDAAATLDPNQLPVSHFIGVNWHKQDRKWVVSIRHAGQTKHIGYFSREQEEVAARAFDAAARQLRGPTAHSTRTKLNFPTPEEQKNLQSSPELTTQPVEITNELLNDHETINELFDDHLPLTLQIKDEWTPQPMMMGVADHHQLLPSVNSFSDNNDEENEAVSQQQQPLQEHLTTSPVFALDDPSDTEPPPHSYYDVSNQPPAVLGNDSLLPKTEYQETFSAELNVPDIISLDSSAAGQQGHWLAPVSLVRRSLTDSASQPPLKKQKQQQHSKAAAESEPAMWTPRGFGGSDHADASAAVRRKTHIVCAILY
jgi:hypothetical protein